MSDDDWLSATLREVAREDATEPAPVLDAALATAFRARWSTGRRGAMTPRRVAIAAMLVAAIAIGFRQVSRIPPANAPPSTHEIATAFFLLPYAAVPSAGAEIVRVELSRTSLAAIGLLPIDSTGVQGTVQADVIVGEDGLARAIRFVRVSDRQSD